MRHNSLFLFPLLLSLACATVVKSPTPQEVSFASVEDASNKVGPTRTGDRLRFKFEKSEYIKSVPEHYQDLLASLLKSRFTSVDIVEGEADGILRVSFLDQAESNGQVFRTRLSAVDEKGNVFDEITLDCKLQKDTAGRQLLYYREKNRYHLVNQQNITQINFDWPEQKRIEELVQSITMGKIVILSTSNEAEVFLDAKSIGHPPISLNLKEGVHSIEVKRNGYDVQARKVRIIPGKYLQVFFAYAGDPQLKPAIIQSYPTGYRVAVEGTVTGETPVHLPETQGTLSVELSNPKSNVVVAEAEMLADEQGDTAERIFLLNYTDDFQGDLSSLWTKVVDNRNWTGYKSPNVFLGDFDISFETSLNPGPFYFGLEGTHSGFVLQGNGAEYTFVTQSNEGKMQNDFSISDSFSFNRLIFGKSKVRLFELKYRQSDSVLKLYVDGGLAAERKIGIPPSAKIKILGPEGSPALRLDVRTFRGVSSNIEEVK